MSTRGGDIFRTHHPHGPKVIYFGAATGGVWKTIDGGMSWEPILADLNALFDGEISEFRALTRGAGIELLAS